jgi:signal transduction histidine kinase
VLRITRVALDRHRELALVAVFLALAAWEIFEFAVLERRDTPPPLPVAVLTHSLQVLVILVATWLVLRVWREKSNREAALRSMIEQVTFAQEAERRRVAYEIHDGLAQLIVSGAQHLDTAADVMRDEPARAGEELARGQERLQRAIVETRRILMALRPSSLDALGLAGAVRELVDDLERQGGPPVTLDEDLGAARLPSTVEAAAFRIVQEAVGNAIRHSAASEIAIALRRGADAVSVAVSDSGVGFADRLRGRGLGLDSMRERARLVGGRLAIVTAPGAGTVVEAWLPIDARG